MPLGRSILYTGDCFIPTKNQHHIKDTGGCRPSCKGCAERCCKLTKLRVFLFGKAIQKRLKVWSAPASSLQMRRQFFQYATGYRIERSGCFLIGGDGAFDGDKRCFIKEFTISFGALFELGHSRFKK